MLALVEAISAPQSEVIGTSRESGVNTLSCQPALARVPLTHSQVTPVARERYALHLTMSKQLNEKLRHAQDLLGHQIPSADIPQVLELALDALIRILEKRKFGAT